MHALARLKAAAVLAAVVLLGLAGAAGAANCTYTTTPNTSGVTQNSMLEVLQSLCNQGYTSSATITRTNDTNAYAANDIVGAATGATAAKQLSGIGPAGGGEVMITSARLEIDASAVISGETSYALYCYNVTPPSASGDNAAFDIPSGDRASLIAKISLGTPIDEGSTLLIETDGINKQITVPSGGAIWCYLVTVGAYTPTASRVYVVTLKSVGL